jgi:hypothetical protein
MCLHKNSMKKLPAALLTGVLFSASIYSASASSGIFGTGVAISSDITGSSTFKLYETTLLGDGRLAPNTGGGGSSLGAPTLVNTDNGSGTSTWATGGAGQPTTGPSLGTFAQGVDTLTLNGGEDLTYKNSGTDVTGAQVFYRIDSGTFTQINLAFNQDNVNGNGGDQRWYTDGANVNLLTGLGAGTHTLSVYFRDNNTADVNDYVSNSSFNYNAIFVVTVPEPSTIALSAVSGLAMLFMLRRRR